MKKELIYKRKHCQISTSEEQEVSFIKSELLNAFNGVGSSILPASSVESQFPALSLFEKAKIEEVTGYFKSFKEESSIKNIIDQPQKEVWLAHGEEYVREVVRATRNIPCLENYTMEDRLTMVRNYVTIFFDMRYVFTFDHDGEFGLVQDLLSVETPICFRTPLDMWDEFISPELKQAWKDMVLTNKSVMLNDPIVRDLLITMALFRNHDKISCPEMMRLHYLEYYYLLKRYLQVKLKSRDRYEKHIKHFHRVLNEFDKLHECSRQFYNFISPHYQSSLMAEIYEE